MPAAVFSERIKRLFSFERTLLLIFLIAFVLRFAALDLKLLHHDEAIHAWFSYGLLTGGGWSYDPSYHGPFLYYVTTGMFALFGASDPVARILPSLFGLMLIPLVWCIHRLGYLDRNQTLVAALLLALSPEMVYFSRFLRHDIFMLFFTLLLIAALLAYFVRGRTTYAVLAAIAAAGGLACKEEMPVILLILAAFFAIAAYRRWIVLPLHWKRDALLGILLITAILSILYSGFGTHPETLVGENFQVALTGIHFNTSTTGWYQAIEHWSAMHNQQRLGGPWFFYIPLYLLYELPIFILAAIATVQFLVPPERIRLAVKRMGNRIRFGISSLSAEDLARVSLQQLAPRPEGQDKRDLFIRLCIWWMILSMAFYAWVGEKVPWLIIHQLLPMILVATYRFDRYKIAFSAIGIVFLIGMTWHVAFVPADINEPIVQVQNSEDLRVVMGLMDRADRVVLASKNYWPLPWYYRGDRWNRITMYDENKDVAVLTEKDPDMIILHDAASYDAIQGYSKKTYKLSYWFSFYDNEHRLLDYYIHRDGRMGSINIDVFTRDGFS